MGKVVRLVDAVDRLLDRGTVVAGTATLSLANVDLVYLQLNLLLSSVETLIKEQSWGAPGSPLQDDAEQPPQAVSGGRRPAGRLSAAAGASPSPVAQPSTALEKPDKDSPYNKTLTQLVLTLAELLRQLMERQAIRRMSGGSLSPAEVERLGLALKGLEEEMAHIRSVFGIKEEQMQLDLGPIGRLL